MCGICGFYGEGEEDLLEEMSSCLVHRGPDSEGHYRKDEVGLAARRLAIVGVDSGQQPIYNEDKSIIAVFNGEIYNFRELKSSLEAKDHYFRSKTDTEVIVHLYEEYGEDFVNKLNGMFSIAIWDDNREKLILYRDRLGIKPLFYFRNENGFYFGSELKSLLQTGISLEPNITALSYFWNLRYVPAPYTAFEGVKQLEPGHMITVEDNEVNKTDYWELKKNKPFDREINEYEYIEDIREIIKDSVENRIPSEVSFGVLLSGGVDSSTLVALLDEFTDEEIDTFSAIFNDDEHDERYYSRLVSNEFDTNHFEYCINEETANKVESILSKFSNPVADPAIIPTYLICLEASKENKVVFTGSGSDELFGGYKRYMREFERYKICCFFPDFSKKLSKKLSEVLPRELKITRYLEYLGNSITQEDLFYHIISKDSPFEDCSNLQRDIENIFSYEEDYMSRTTRFDIKYWLPNMLLTKIDRCSMNNSIEARVPFLDHNIVDKSRNIPWKYKLNNGEPKSIIKKAFSSHLPEEVLDREVTGLSVPIEEWMKSDENRISSRFQKSRFEKIDFLDEEEIMRRYRALKKGESRHTQFLWKALVIQIWHENYLQRFQEELQ